VAHLKGLKITIFFAFTPV